MSGRVNKYIFVPLNFFILAFKLEEISSSSLQESMCLAQLDPKPKF